MHDGGVSVAMAGLGYTLQEDSGRRVGSHGGGCTRACIMGGGQEVWGVG